MENGTALQSTAFKDRSGWLVFFGLIEIVIGAFCALAAVFAMVIILFADRIPNLQADGFIKLVRILGLAIYSVAAMLFISAGIGTWRGRRWARILMLVVSSLWLAFGILGSLFLLALLPILRQSVQSSVKDTPQSAIYLVLGLVGGMVVLMEVLLPGAFLIFYTRKSVHATFQHKDLARTPIRRCPIPVLAASLWIGLGAVGSLFTLPFGVKVLFGVILKGFPAIVLGLALTGIQGFLALGFYKLERRAWLGTIAFEVLLGASAVVTFSRVSLWQLSEEMGVRAPNLELSRAMLESMQRWMPVQTALVGGIFLAFLLYLGRYFRREVLPNADVPQRESPAPRG